MFIVTSWTNPNDELQTEMRNTGYVYFMSHTHEMHEGGCSGEQHGAKILCIDHSAGVNDLKTSAEMIGNADALAYPTGDNNAHSRAIVEEAGFSLGFTVDYGKVTSSRGVIKNQYINTAVTKGFYGVDIWTEYGDLLYPYLINGMQVFSEIVGYVTGGQSMIQKGYDYGCTPGTNKIMPYRITVNNDDGTVTEWDVMEVYGWTLQLLKEHPELKDKVMPIDILYHGTLGDLYPEVNKEQHWNDNVLVAMRNDKEHFKMEENEPLCKNKMPREGVVIRIDGDAKSEAFKLKTYKFLGKEAELMDKGEVDAEMDEAYVN
jgi:hypothetical protein